MKKYLLLIFVLCFILPVIADNEVYLDLNASDIHRIQTFTTDYGNNNKKAHEKDDWSEEKDMVLHPFQYIKDEIINDSKKDN
jgi:hypothetical protein